MPTVDRRAVLAMAAALAISWPARADSPPTPPPALARRLPAGFGPLAIAELRFGQPERRFVVVALGRSDERRGADRPAPARPLLIFERRGAEFTPAGRNDTVVLKADEGGQCDPFLDGDATIAVKGRYFTVQNGVACGEHWTDYVTFRFEDRAGGFVFDNERVESWKLNPDERGEALVRDGAPSITRARPGATVGFSAWRPRR